MVPASLKRYAWLSIAAALATMLLKGWAWWLTGSVGLLSDALESFVNLAGAMMALAMLSLAAMPADDSHAHGHGKAEYFSSAFEGFLILVAAVSIGYAAIERMLNTRSRWKRGGHRAGGVGARLDHQPGHLAHPHGRGPQIQIHHAGSRCASSSHRRLDLCRRHPGRGAGVGDHQ